jgi:hypothetical protein
MESERPVSVVASWDGGCLAWQLGWGARGLRGEWFVGRWETFIYIGWGARGCRVDRVCDFFEDMI